MELTLAKKVVIITEGIIEEQVLRLLDAQGVKGYTVYRGLAGKGASGVRSGLGGGIDSHNENVRLETIVAGEERALSVMEAVYNKFLFEKYAGIIYLEDVRVVRPGRF